MSQNIVTDFNLDLVFFCMSILTEDEYRELFEVAGEYREMLSRLSDGRLDLEGGEEPEGVEELSDVGAVFYRLDEENDLYAVSSSLGDEVLEHLEKGGGLEQYLAAMERQEEIFKEVYSS